MMPVELELTGERSVVAFIHVHKLRKRNAERMEIRRGETRHLVEFGPRKEMDALYGMIVAYRRGNPFPALRNRGLDSRLRPRQRFHSPLESVLAEILQGFVVALRHDNILERKTEPLHEPVVQDDKLLAWNIPLGKFKFAVDDVPNQNGVRHRIGAPLPRQIAKIPELP